LVQQLPIGAVSRWNKGIWKLLTIIRDGDGRSFIFESHGA
jgi:hypothetical protein